MKMAVNHGGLRPTHQALATPDVVKQIAAIGSDCSQFVVELLDFWKNVQAKLKALMLRQYTTLVRLLMLMTLT